MYDVRQGEDDASNSGDSHEDRRECLVWFPAHFLTHALNVEPIFVDLSSHLRDPQVLFFDVSISHHPISRL